MKILLKQDVINLGYAGEVMNVANGHGRNYLIPQGLAVIATAGVLKEAEIWRQRASVRITEIRKEHESLSADINNSNLVFTARAGETGKLYGSITTADIADKMNEQLGTDIDRRIISSESLRQLGEHRVTIKLSRDFHPQVTVYIHPLETQEDEIEEAPEVEADAEMEKATEAEVIEGAPVEVVAEGSQLDDGLTHEDELEDEDEIQENELDSISEIEAISPVENLDEIA